jgi:hypothetical protein
MSPAALSFVLHETVRRNRVRDGIVYLQITRGAAPRDFPFPAAGTQPSVVATARSNDPAKLTQFAADGIAVITVPDIRWQRVDIKSVSLLPNVLAKQAARDKGAREAWLVDEQGRITEGASSNAWIVDKNGTLVTHPLGRDILPGITIGRDRRGEGAGHRLRGARLHGRGGLCRTRSFCDIGEPDRPSGREHRRVAGRQWCARVDRICAAPRLSSLCRDQLSRPGSSDVTADEVTARAVPKARGLGAKNHLFQQLDTSHANLCLHRGDACLLIASSRRLVPLVRGA